MPDHSTDTVEVWKTIPECVDFYEASSLGRIRRIARASNGRGNGCVMKQRLDDDGYLRLSLTMGEIRLYPFAHVLVAHTFLGPCPKAHQVNHKDGVKTNNQPDNLEYETGKGNIQHAIKAGLWPIGERNGSAKLTNQQAAEIKRELKANYHFGILSELSRRYGVSVPVIAAIRDEKIWAHIQITSS